MVIKVQYDARNRTFKLVDQEFRTLLEGDALYYLALPLMLEEDFVDDGLAVDRPVDCLSNGDVVGRRFGDVHIEAEGVAAAGSLRERETFVAF